MDFVDVDLHSNDGCGLTGPDVKCGVSDSQKVEKCLVEERRDIFEFFALERLKEEQRRREYIEREPLKPEVIQRKLGPPPPPPGPGDMPGNAGLLRIDIEERSSHLQIQSQTNVTEAEPEESHCYRRQHPSMDYLANSKVVHNMRLKWEEMLNTRSFSPRCSAQDTRQHAYEHKQERELHQHHASQCPCRCHCSPLLEKFLRESATTPLHHPLEPPPSPSHMHAATQTRIMGVCDQLVQTEPGRVSKSYVEDRTMSSEPEPSYYRAHVETPRMTDAETEVVVTNRDPTDHQEYFSAPEQEYEHEYVASVAELSFKSYQENLQASTREHEEVAKQNHPTKRNSDRMPHRSKIQKHIFPVFQQSVEGLLPVRQCDADVPHRPGGSINSTVTQGRKSCDVGADSSYVSRVPSSEAGYPCGNEVARYAERNNSASSRHSTDVDLKNAYTSGTGSKIADDEEYSSVALEVEGTQARRATFEEFGDDLEQLEQDFDTTVAFQVNTSADIVRVSQSKLNVGHGCPKAIVKSLSQESISFANANADEQKPCAPKPFLDDSRYYTCQKCRNLIKPKEPSFRFNSGHIWHRSCFVCKTCTIQLGEMDHLMHDGDPYCYDHYILVAQVPTCYLCHEYILDPTYTSAAGVSWHFECFSCSACRRPLVDTKYIGAQGEIFCLECHLTQFRKICSSCQVRIKPWEVYVQAGKYFWHSNDACLHCENCRRNLVGHSVLFKKNGKLFCNRHCATLTGNNYNVN